MLFDLNDFHFIRPALLWLLIPAFILILYLKNKGDSQSSWQTVISPHLLAFLSTQGLQQQNKRRNLWLISSIILLLITAISGPSFRQKSVPVFQSENMQVILLDLSLSMDATDVKPSRIERAKFKLMDLLDKTKEGSIALVVYAGDAFTISPLTSDANTIANMIPTLSTGIMPVLGSRPDLAIKKSIELLQNAKATQGEIIWLTDGVEPEFVDEIVESVTGATYHLSILAVGTEQGAPIPLPDGNGFLKDSSGSIVVPKLEINDLTKIANRSSAGFIKLTADNSDIQYLQQFNEWQASENQAIDSNEQKISRWIDDGYWLVWLVLILFFVQLIRQPNQMIRNLMVPFVGLLLTTGYSPDSSALEWQDLWATKNQRATDAFQQGDYEKAAKLFEKPEWQAASQYKNGDYEKAAENFDPNSSIDSLYNHATSLAKAQQLQPALDAYNRLLETEPTHSDALFNKKIVEDLLQQQQNQDQQNQDQENQDQQNQDQQNQDQNQQSDQENQSEQDQQSEQQQSEEQQSEEQKAQQQQADESEQEQQQQAMEMTEDEREKSEKDQALEHWLKKIPDDPGGLLRRKMYREYQRRGREQKEKKLW